MAKTERSRAHLFKKGQTGNPNGRPTLNPAQKALRSLTIDTYREVVELVLTGNLAQLKAMAEHPETPAIQVGIAVSFMKAIKSGDYTIIERIAERIIGKIPDVVNVNSNANVNMVAKVTTIDQAALKAALDKLKQDV